MLVSINGPDGRTHWMTAPVADPDSKDIRDMKVARDIRAKTTQELYDSIPDRLPCISPDSVVRKATAAECAWTPGVDVDKVFKVKEDVRELVAGIEEWNWSNVFTFV